MKIKFLLLLGVLLITACQPLQAGQSPVPVDCPNPGTTQRLRLEQTSRSYSYSYEVYLPPCFDPEAKPGYPVLYLVPGRGSGPGAWFAAGAVEAVDEAILKGDIPPFIIIATENIDSDPQASLILNDLMPAVEADYPIRQERRYRAVAGGSLGGVAAYRMVFANPGKFSSAAMFGSGLISGEEEQMKTWLKALKLFEKPRVFLNSGTQDPFMLERAEVMASLLYENSVSHMLLIGEGGHTYDYWVSNFPAYLRWLAEDWR
jgi:enterochelin esterase-like enzyme